jgi:GAF domain-containing protein
VGSGYHRVVVVIGGADTGTRATSDSAKLQDALYRIADMASAASDLPQFYRAMHEIVAELTYGENLFICLYDEENQLLNYAYYADQVDEDIPDPNDWEPIGTGQARGLTGYVMRTGQTQWIPSDRFHQLVAAGEVEAVGLEGSDWVGVPLKSEGAAIGALVVQTYEPGQVYTQQDVDLLTFVGQHVASALSRARSIAETKRLLVETDQRAAELAVINSVQGGLALQVDMQRMYELVGDKIQEIFDAQVVDIGVLDAEAGVIRFPYAIERGVRFPDEPITVMGIRKHVLETLEPVVINEDNVRRTAEVGQMAAIQGEIPKSSLFAPLVVGSEATGVISLQNLDRENAFSEADVRLLTTLASSLSVALENARLIDETRQRAAELGIVNRVGQAISAQLDPDALVQMVGEQVRDTMNADIVYVALLDSGRGIIEFPYYFENGPGERPPAELPYGEGWTSQVLRAREPLLINSQADRETFETRALGTLPLSYLGVPILIGEEAIGVIAVQSTREEGRFGASDERLLATIGAGVGAAIQNSRLYGETRRLYGEAREYLDQVHKVTDAAVALETGEFNGDSLTAVAQRPDALGQLAKTFQRMASEVVAREARLLAQVQELRIEIDEAKQSQKVAEITGSDYFKDLRLRADDLRRTVRQPNSSGE